MQRRITWIHSTLLAAHLTVAFATQASAQDRMVLGPRQFEFDTSGSGAVLCSWAIYLSIRTGSKACGLSRQPIDDAIDDAIAKIDVFIIANSSLRPTPAMLEDFKHWANESKLESLRRSGLEKYCNGHDLKMFRRPTPDQIQESVRKLLAKPREPTMNPCL